MSINEMIAAIESHFNAQLPETYKKWMTLGYMDDNDYTANDAEWLPFDEITTTMNERFDYVNILGDIIPFAVTAGGDHWCFDIKDGKVQAILICSHDDDDADVYAPDFEKWFYRCALEECLSLYVIDTLENAKVRVKESLESSAKILLDCGQNEMADDLKSIAARSPIEIEMPRYTYHALLTGEEYEDHVKQFLGEEFLKQKVQWSEYKED